MKKLFAFVLALCLFCCAALAEESSAVTLGMWSLTAMKDAEGNVTEAPMTMILAVYSDSTFAMASDDDEMTGTWAMNEAEDGLILTMQDGSVQEMTSDPETGDLYTEDQGMTLIFTVYTAELPDIVAAASIDDFQGTWLINGALMDGHYYDLTNESEETMIMFFGSATPSIVITGDQVDVREGRRTGTAAFEDGGLVVTDGDTTFFVSLLDDGRITTAIGDALISDYFAVKAE